jgi:hypothetical protein
MSFTMIGEQICYRGVQAIKSIHELFTHSRETWIGSAKYLDRFYCGKMVDNHVFRLKLNPDDTQTRTL